MIYNPGIKCLSMYMDVGILQGYIQPIISWAADISHLQLTKSTNLAPAVAVRLLKSS